VPEDDGKESPAAAAARRGGTVILSVHRLSKRFGAVTALDEVSIDFRAGEVHCLLGENGAGKSTLCNIIFGLIRPDGGEMGLAGAPHRPTRPAMALRAGIAMVHQHFSLVPTLSVLDNLMLGQGRGVLNPNACTQQVTELTREYGLTIDLDAGISDLSVGERQVVEIVKCLIRRPQVIILDEPTAVLPPEEVGALLTLCRRLTEGGRAIVLVTHKLAEIRRAADRVTVLRGGRVTAQSISPSDDINELVRAMIQRDLAALGTLSIPTLGELSDAAPEPALSPPEDRGRGTAVRIDNLTLRRDDGARTLDGVTLTVAKGEIVGLAGVEGNGQRELAWIIAGLQRPESGTVMIGERDIVGATPAEIDTAGVGVVPEDRHGEGSIAEMTVAENLQLNRIASYTHFGFIDHKALRARARVLIQQFDIRAAGPDAPFVSLSGGNQQKCVLAREIARANLVFLLASQPTRGLDIGAIDSIYRHLRDSCARGAGILLISSELDELLAVADRILVIYRGRIVGERPANPQHRQAIGAMMSGHLG
jgi:general nucleoside transport system ATP-binding protein